MRRNLIVDLLDVVLLLMFAATAVACVLSGGLLKLLIGALVAMVVGMRCRVLVRRWRRSAPGEHHGESDQAHEDGPPGATYRQAP